MGLGSHVGTGLGERPVQPSTSCSPRPHPNPHPRRPRWSPRSGSRRLRRAPPCVLALASRALRPRACSSPRSCRSSTLTTTPPSRRAAPSPQRCAAPRRPALPCLAQQVRCCAARLRSGWKHSLSHWQHQGCILCPAHPAACPAEASRVCGPAVQTPRLYLPPGHAGLCPLCGCCAVPHPPAARLPGSYRPEVVHPCLHRGRHHQEGKKGMPCSTWLGAQRGSERWQTGPTLHGRTHHQGQRCAPRELTRLPERYGILQQSTGNLADGVPVHPGCRSLPGAA